MLLFMLKSTSEAMPPFYWIACIPHKQWVTEHIRVIERTMNAPNHMLVSTHQQSWAELAIDITFRCHKSVCSPTPALFSLNFHFFSNLTVFLQDMVRSVNEGMRARFKNVRVYIPERTFVDLGDSDPKSLIPGFVYWHKNGRLGMGFWVRNQIEFMMIGIKGNVSAFRSANRNFVHLLETPVLVHSEKPGELRKLVETITKSMGKRKKIELFERSPAKGWKSWGDQLGV